MKQQFYVWYDNLMENYFSLEVEQMQEKFLSQIVEEKNLVLKIDGIDHKDALMIYREKVALNEYQSLSVNSNYQVNVVKSSPKFLH